MTEPTSQWNEYKIEELGRVVTGHTPLKSVKEYYESNDYTWIKPTDIRKGERYVLETEEYYSQKAFEKFKNFLLPPLSTCVVTIGTVGEKICLTHKYCFSNQSINAIVPDRQKFDPMFVYYLLKYNLDQVAQRNPGTSSGRDHVSKSNISSIVVKAPSKQTQSKISAILARYDDLLENNARRIKILEEMAQAMYREWFVNFRFPGHEGVRMVESELGPVPEGWVVQTVEKTFEILGGGTPSTKVQEYWKSGEINWYSPVDLTAAGTMFIENSGNKINELGLKKSSARLFPAFSVMMTSRATLGVISINTTEACTNQGFITCIPNAKFPLYLLYHWLKENVGYLISLGTGSTFKEITKGTFKTVQLVVPQPNVAIQFEKIVEPLAAQILCLQRKNANLRRTRDLLLPKLISGKIDVSDLNIEIPVPE